MTALQKCLFYTMVSRQRNKKYMQKVGVINEKTTRFNPTGKNWTYQLTINCHKKKFSFFNSRMKAKCLKRCVFSTSQINLHQGIRRIVVNVCCLKQFIASGNLLTSNKTRLMSSFT